MHDASVGGAERDVERVDIPYDNERAIRAAGEGRQILLREPWLLERLAFGPGAIRMRVERANRAGHAVAASRHRELKALHVVRGHPADHMKGVAARIADEAAEIFLLRRL